MFQSLTFYLNGQYIFVSYYCDDERLRMPTGSKIAKEKWEKQDIPKDIKIALSRLDLLATEYIGACNLAGVPVLKEDLREKLLGKSFKKVKVKSTKRKLYEAVSKVRDMMISKDLLKKEDSTPYSDSVIKTFKTILQTLETLPFKDKDLNYVTIEDFGLFKGQMLRDEYAQNTIALNVTYFKYFFEITHGLKWHKNKIYLEKDISVPWDKLDYAVYTTPEEIKLIHEFEIPKGHKFKFPNKGEQGVSVRYLNKVKDLFVFGTQVCLRKSDLFSIDPKMMSRDWILNVSTEKRDKEVFVPVSPLAKEIWRKYNHNIPHVQDYAFNYCIKEICRLVGLDEQILFTRMEGGVRIKKYMHKWEMVSTHTMRRSFATNAMLAGVPVPAIMKIGGWSTESSFFKYLRISGKENAKRLQSHSFFN